VQLVMTRVERRYDDEVRLGARTTTSSVVGDAPTTMISRKSHS